MAKTKNSMLDAKTKTSKESGNTNITRKDIDPVERGMSLYRSIKIAKADYQAKLGKKAYYYKNETYDMWVKNAADLKDLKAFAELYDKLDNSFFEFRTTHGSMKATEVQELIAQAVAQALAAAGVQSQKSADKKAAKTAAKAARKVEVEESE